MNGRYVSQPPPPPGVRAQTNGLFSISPQDNNNLQQLQRPSDRPGNFPNLADFASPIAAATSPPVRNAVVANTSANHNRTLSSSSQPNTGVLAYRSHREDPLQVGQIVHIRDYAESRINNRLVYILRPNDGSFTCLSFCQHSIIPVEHHVRVLTASIRPERTSVRVVRLNLSWNGTSHEPLATTFLNLREIWNVESADDIKFARLGSVTTHCRDNIAVWAADIFARSLRRASRSS